jgi:hypothetical protein
MVKGRRAAVRSRNLMPLATFSVTLIITVGSKDFFGTVLGDMDCYSRKLMLLLAMFSVTWNGTGNT